uniref:Non-ribosomal peptide synthase domain TIGR01720/amino acid adenylation domain-containing protein n=1 Tax=Candidatus Kentrum sp. FW TaxID=2126338 RepID=A0A450SHT6_9GAMM|nr:MAG: non-ribosomal peptide synthase domain TIGR01720/amino acid adenylation domain-containing protein [Candidatus Kentron sp. FW]
MSNATKKKTNLSMEEKRALLARKLRTEVDSAKSPGVSGKERTTFVGEAWPPLTPDPDGRFLPFPLTDIQEAYLLGRVGGFELGGFSVHEYIEVDCPYDETQLIAFNQACQRLIERHDMLRATIEPDGRLRVLEEVPTYVIPSTDLTGRPEEVVQGTLAKIREEMSHEVIDTYTWPAFNIRATRIGQRLVRLHFSFDILMMDASSLSLLYKELFHLTRNPEVTLPPLALTFRDYVLTRKKIRDTAHYKQARDYWFGHLDELPPAPELPLAVAPETLSAPRFSRRIYTLSAGVWRRLKDRGAKAGLTVSGILLAAFAEILTIWSKPPRFTINLTQFDRLSLHPQINDIVGDFTSLLLVQIDNTFAESFERRADRIQKQLWENLSHNAISAVEVLRELTRRRGGDYATMPVVFTSMLGLGSVEEDMLPSNWLGEFVYNITQTPQVWIDHQVFEYNGELIFNWDCVDELFPPGLLDEMFAAYCRLLELLSIDESAWQRGSLYELLLTEQLAKRAIVNDTAGAVSPALLHDFFIAQARERPDAPAVIAPGRTLSYGELLDLAKRTAHWLQRHDVAPNTPANTLIAVVMEKGWEQVVAVLGILMAGGAYLPIDAHLPAARRNDLLTDGEAHLALTQPRFSDLEWPDGTRRFVISEENLAQEAANVEEASVTETATGPEELAYVIYTSGSTGRPKGVMIDHRGAVNTILDINRRFTVTQADRVLCLSALNFDLSVYDIFGVLAAGGVLVIPEEEGLRDPAHWQALMFEHGITLWNTVPALKQMLVEHLESRAEPVPPGMRLVMMSGDWIPLDLPGRIRALWPEVEIIGLGGATEASIWSNFYPIEEFDPDWKSIPYGKPLANQFFQVLDGNLEPRPVWVPGDLYIGGIGLAKGYWNDPAKTAERFITHPDTHKRLYRTGDLGRYLPDGNLEFLGRSDFQVKIRGHRIELGEIEAVLTSHPAIREAVVTAVGEERNLDALAAYVVPFDPGQFGDGIAEELKAHVGAGLPGYMVPATFTVLDALPLTASGKVDRRALPDPDSAIDGDNYEPPRNADEQQLATIWSEVLKRPDIGIHDNFFDLGGDSILGIQIVARARGSGLGFSPRDIFQHQTIAELARIIQPIGEVSVEQGQVQGDVPLTPIQSWFFNGDGTEPWYFNQTELLEVSTDVEESVLEQALAVVLGHHDVFRLRYWLEEGAWRQGHVATVTPDERLPFYVESLSGLDELERRADHWQASLDLEHGPLTRLVLFRTEMDARLLWVIHHLIVDGLSWRILIEDLQNAYNAIKTGRTPQLPAKTSSFKLWSERLREWRGSDAFALEANWWRQLPQSNVPFPMDYPEGTNQVADTCYHTLTFDPDITRRLLIDSPSAYRTSVNDLLLAALLLALGDWTGRREHVIDLESHGRTDLFDDVDLSRTVGWFTALYTVALELPAGGDLGDVIKTIKEQLREVPFDGVGYGVLRQQGEELPQGQIVFNYWGQFDQTGQEDGFQFARETTGRSVSLTGSRDHLIDIIGITVHGRLSLTFGYSEKQYREATIRALAEGYRNHLEALIGHCREHHGYTPSDFTLAGVSQDQLNELAEIYG